MTLSVCRRCDGPCQCDPGLLENEARRWDGYDMPAPEPVKQVWFCCRQKTPPDYVALAARLGTTPEKERMYHRQLCAATIVGCERNRHDPLARGPRHIDDWAEEEEWGEPPPERVQ